MIDRLYLAYTRADAEWLVSDPELLKAGKIIYSGIEPHLVLRSAGISADDAVDLYRQLDFVVITNEVEYLRSKFEQTLRKVSSDSGVSLIYRDIDVLFCSLHLLYYFFFEAVTSYHLAIAILRKYKPNEIWVNQSPFTPVTQWGLAPPPQINYENQVWGAIRNERVTIKPLEIPNVESSNYQQEQFNFVYRSQYQPWQPQNNQINTVNPGISSLQSDILLALQSNFIKNYAPIGQGLANSLNVKTLDLIQETLWFGWHGNSHSISVPVKYVGNISTEQINQILNDRRFAVAFSDYPLDIWRIIQSRVDFLLCFDIPIVCSWIERAYWILDAIDPKFIVMAEEVSLPARSLGAVAELHGIKKLVVEHGAPISFDTRISGKGRSDLLYWQRNYGETKADYVAVWGAYARRYYLEGLNWSLERVIPTGWSWIEREIGEHLSTRKIKSDNHAELRLLFLSTSTYKSYHYLYETLFEAVKYFSAEIVIRPHGAENINYLHDLADLNGISIKIDNSANILDQIAESEIVLGGATSVLSYAIALGKPSIFVDLLGMRDFMPYALEGAAIGVYDPEELIPAIEKLLNDPEERYRQQEKQKLFTQQYLGSLDGKATERIINFVKMKLNMQNQLSLGHLQSIAKTDKLRVDIGCGNHKPENFIGVDIAPGIGVDIVADISKEFPFPDSSIYELRAHDIIEHLPDRINTMNEIWRVCKPGAKVDIRVPSTDGRGAFQDPTHVSFWNINSFFYYCSEFPAYLELCKRYGFKGEFKVVKLEHEETPGGVIHVIAELSVVKPVSSLSKQQITGNIKVDHQYQKLIEENDYLKFLFSSQPYFQEIGEADNYYQYLQNSLDYLHTSIFSNSDSDLWNQVVNNFIQSANFIPAYFNEKNLKNIYVKRAEILELFLKNNGCEVDYEFPARPTNRKKIRLGILATHFTPGSETFAYLPVYEYLSRDFEVVLYSLKQTGHSLEQYCRSCANSFKLLPQNLSEQVNTIRADDLDILFIATNVTAVTNQICLLATHRLARIQVTSGGSVVTTGMRHMDYYISSTLTDPSPTAQEHYREKLVKLEGTAHCFSYGCDEEKATVKVDRESLGISEEAVIFISGANFFKIIPELIHTWAKIIAEVPNSVLVLLPFGPNWSNAYPKKAFENNLHKVFSQYGISAERLIILDPQPVPNREDIKEYFKIANIYLDSYPFSGTTSLVEPLQVNLPVISRQGNTFRSAMGAAMVRSLDIPNLVADSEESYIQLAVELGTNPELRKQKSDQIKQKMQQNPSFLDSRSYSAQMGALFQQLFQKYQADTLANQLKLRDINLVMFPNWHQSEESLYEDFANVLKTISTKPDKSRMTLLIDTDGIDGEDANWLFSSVAMNLLMEEAVDIADELEVSLLDDLTENEWQLLLSLLQGRIVLDNENKNAIAKVNAESLTVYS
jgi:predicted O-linked N-acetylglucosamine transferase (SPINDLY family)